MSRHCAHSAWRWIDSALLQAQQAYRSLSTQDDAAAVAQARAAVELAPEVATYRLLLITAQLQQGQLADAERSADQALQADGQDLNARVMRGYLRQRQGNSLLANEDFDAALAMPGFNDAAAQRAPAGGGCGPGRWGSRTCGCTAGAAAGGGAGCQAMHARSSFCSRASSSAPRRSVPVASVRMSAQTYPAPFQHCQSGDSGNRCELMPADLQGDGGAAQRAYAAYARQDYAEAIGEARQAVQLAPDDANLQGC
jgi:tetratricopeptide (TPR) repeat protein